MVWKNHEYDTIPGTYIFDGQRAHHSFNLNKLFFSFNEQKNREEFDADPALYCDKFGLTDEQKEMVIKQDFLGILRAGTNIYYMAKFCIPRGLSVQDAGASFQGISTDEFKQNLLKKREGLREKLRGVGGYWDG